MRLIINDGISLRLWEQGNVSACKIFWRPAHTDMREWGMVGCREVSDAKALELCKPSASPLQSLSINKYLFFELVLQ